MFSLICIEFGSGAEEKVEKIQKIDFFCKKK